MKETKKNIRLIAVLAIVLTVAALAGAGTILARYITTRESEATMQSGNFYVSSSHLEASGAAYDVTSWNTAGISFDVFNYQKSNPSLLTDGDVKYTVTVPSGWVITVTDNNGDPVEAVSGEYTLCGSGGATRHTVTVKCYTAASAGDTVDVSVNTVSPYAKTISASFTLIGDPEPEYRIDDKGTYVLVTLYSNNYSGTVTVKWTADFSPDNTNPLMTTWTDIKRSQNISVVSSSTYELIFYKNTSDDYSKSLTSGMIVDVGS